MYKSLGLLLIGLFAAVCFSTTLYAQKAQRYKVGLIDLMLLKRQKLGALPLTQQLGADGVEVDMGGLGNRPRLKMP